MEKRYAPAQYEWSERPVLISSARMVRHVIPATWRDVTETVVVQPPTVRVEHIPPVYDVVSERVVVRPARTEWRRTFVGPDGVIPPGARVEPTGEVVCLVEVPAEYGEVQRQVLREPGRDVQIPVPPVTRTVTRQVLDQPEHVVFEHISRPVRRRKGPPPGPARARGAGRSAAGVRDPYQARGSCRRAAWNGAGWIATPKARRDRRRAQASAARASRRLDRRRAS